MNLQKQNLMKVLQKFNKHNVKYVVLRNYEFLFSEDFPIESLDTSISKEDMALAHQILRSFGFKKRSQQFSQTHKAYYKMENLAMISFDIQVGGIHWNDMKYLDQRIFTNRRQNDYFNVLSNNDYFIMLVVHSILGKRYFKPKYQSILRGLLKNSLINENYVLQKLSSIFSQKQAIEIFNNIKANKFEDIQVKRNLTSFLLRKPHRLSTLFFLSMRWLKQRKNPFRIAPLISIIGPDGAGKSTMVEKVNQYLQETGRKTTLIYTGRGRNHILPITKLGRLYKKSEKKKKKIKRTDINKTLSNLSHPIKKPNLKKQIIYTLASPIFTLDLFLRYVFRILPQRFKGNISITDRYCSDIILMDNVPFSIRKLLLRIFPKPTMTFYLYNQAEILKQRRPEESLAGLKRQMYYFSKLNDYLKPMVLITNDEKENFEQVINSIMMRLYYKWY
tara:strand:+ start:60709 stop:62046 length:1338 start_codon:yes stop_codon:yes gene_type:complete